jgi:hypothetical protein
MAAEHTSQSEPANAPAPAGHVQDQRALDEAVDAIVYDVHPALRPAARQLHDGDAYPYGPRVPYDFEALADSASYKGTKAARNVLRWISDTTGQYIEVLNRPPDFVVPKRFGMSAILGIMTALAVLFGCLRWINAFPVLYFFFGVQALAICLVQMFYGQTPRLASIIAGAIILPVFTIVAAVFSDQGNPGLVCAAIGFVPVGGLLGYLTGTCAAGVFLVMDYLEPYLQGQAFHGPAATSASSSAAPSP